MFIESVVHSLKGGLGVTKLGPKTLIVGPSATGKTALINAIELVLTGAVSDVRYRDVVAESSLISELRRGNDPLGVSIRFDTGEVASYNIERGKAKGVQTAPAWLSKDRVMLGRRVLDALRGKPETTRRFLLATVVGAITVADLQIPPHLEPAWKSASAGVQADMPLSDRLDPVIDAAEAQSRHVGARITAEDENIASASAGLTARPTDDELKRIAEFVANLDKQVEVAIAAQVRPTAHHKTEMRQLREGDLRDAENRLAGIQQEIQQTEQAGAQQMQQGVLIRRMNGLVDLLGMAIQNAYGQGHAEQHYPGKPTACPVCSSQVPVEHLVALQQQASAVSAQLQSQSSSWNLEAQLVALRARADVVSNNLAQCQTYLQRAMQEESEAAGVAGDPSQLAQAVANITEQRNLARTFQQQQQTVRTRWDQLASYRSSVTALQTQQKEWDHLVEHLNERIQALVDAKVDDFAQKVQALLPKDWRFVLKLRDGKRQVCQLGLMVGDHIRTALSGAESAAVLAAISDVCAVDLTYHAIVVPDRQMDARTLGNVLQGLAHAKGQVFVTSTVLPEFLPSGWTIVKTGELGAEPPAVVQVTQDGKPVTDAQLAALAPMPAPAKTRKPRAKKAEPVLPAPGSAVHGTSLTPADVAANAKLQEGEEALMEKVRANLLGPDAPPPGPPARKGRGKKKADPAGGYIETAKAPAGPLPFAPVADVKPKRSKKAST